MAARQAPPGPPPDAWRPVDPLGEALHFLRMDGVIYTRSDLSAPWAVDLPPLPDCLLFHVVTHGRCWLAAPGEQPELLQPGEFTLVPHGEGHRIADDPSTPAVDLFDLPLESVGPRYEVLRHGGGGEPTRLLCGAVRFGHPAARELVRLLPRVIRVRAFDSSQAEWMQSTLRLMASELAEPRPGGEAVVTRLADILVVQAIRSWIEATPAARTGWLGALHDDRIGPALLLVQREPARDWSVASLAAAVSMSRSAFAARFRALVGESPIQYLTRWRMHVAVEALREGGETVAQVGHRLGYRSEAAFSRAFKRCIGVPPAVVRRAGQEAAG